MIHQLWAGMGEALPTQDKVRIFVVAVISQMILYRRPHVLTFQDNPLMSQIFYFMVQFLMHKFIWNYLPEEQRPTLIYSRLVKFEQQEIFASGQEI